MSRILVTGATGNVGSQLTRLLDEAGIPFLAASHRPPGNAPFKHGDWVEFDFARPTSFTFSDFDKVFLMRPPQVASVQRNMLPSLEWFASKKVSHVVVMSVIGADKVPWLPHRKLELAVERIKLPNTVLRPSFFMQNLSGIHSHGVKAKSELLVPAGKAKMSFIDAKDIAETALNILQNPEDHRKKAYTLTGPEALNYKQVSQLLSKHLDKKVDYKNPSVIRFVRYLRGRGFSWAYISVVTSLYTVSRFKPPDFISDDFQKITGHAPTPLEEFIIREKPAWQ